MDGGGGGGRLIGWGRLFQRNKLSNSVDEAKMDCGVLSVPFTSPLGEVRRLH